MSILELDDKAKANLLLAAHWAKIIAIASFVFLGIACICFVGFMFSNTFFAEYATASIFKMESIPYILLMVVALLLLFLYINLLLRFSKKVTVGLNNHDVHEVIQGFKHLKTYFIITGVITVLGMIGDIFSFF
ncbi:MAG: hypothetical protein ACOVMM_02120 [Chitinophagaceae bacterium]